MAEKLEYCLVFGKTLSMLTNLLVIYSMPNNQLRYTHTHTCNVFPDHYSARFIGHILKSFTEINRVHLYT